MFEARHESLLVEEEAEVQDFNSELGLKSNFPFGRSKGKTSVVNG